MFRQELFPTPIWIDRLFLDTDKIKEFCLKLKPEDSVKKSNVGGLQSYDDVVFVEELKELKDCIEEKLNTVVYNDLEIAEDCKFVVDGGWVNVSNKSNFNLPHTHPHAVFSAVYYVSDNNSNIVFEDPRILPERLWTPDVFRNKKLTSDRYEFTPREDNLIIFPGWLKHFVMPSQVDGRISIAFNAVIDG